MDASDANWRNYIKFGTEISDFEKDPKILKQVNHFMHELDVGYSFLDIIGARVTTTRLSDGFQVGDSQHDLDLIWHMERLNYFEIILCGEKITPRYGGWLYGEDPQITDEIINGYRVIETTFKEQTLRHHYEPLVRGYEPIFGSMAAPLPCAQRLAYQRIL